MSHGPRKTIGWDFSWFSAEAVAEYLRGVIMTQIDLRVTDWLKNRPCLVKKVKPKKTRSLITAVIYKGNKGLGSHDTGGKVIIESATFQHLFIFLLEN